MIIMCANGPWQARLVLRHLSPSVFHFADCVCWSRCWNAAGRSITREVGSVRGVATYVNGFERKHDVRVDGDVACVVGRVMETRLASCWCCTRLERDRTGLSVAGLPRCPCRCATRRAQRNTLNFTHTLAYSVPPCPIRAPFEFDA